MNLLSITLEELTRKLETGYGKGWFHARACIGKFLKKETRALDRPLNLRHPRPWHAPLRKRFQ